MRLLLLLFLTSLSHICVAAERPNILIAISDDQSYGHCSAYGCEYISTPAFDEVAKHGVLFNNAYGASPGCSPCRAALLTGRHIWQIEHAGTHASSFPAKYRTYPEVLGENGYFVGYTGKGWGPGNYKVDGRKMNPAGKAYSSRKSKPPYKGISSTDYAANFSDFLKEKPDDQPFCFWFGAHEPHRGFEKGSGLKAGKKLEDATVPGFLPDRPEIRSDLLDYSVEIEWFDTHLGRILRQLEGAGELENTLIIVTSDNGMAFPRAKANCYDAGIHMPLAMSWGKQVNPGRVSDDLVGFVDLTATIYEAAGVAHPSEDFPLVGRSLLDLLKSEKSGVIDDSRSAVFSGRERHSSSRYQTLGYPQRAMRTGDYLVIRNFRPERSPAGPSQKYEGNGKLGPAHGGYHDIDACPSLDFLIQHRDDPELSKFYHWSVDHRPEFEIFNVKSDPDCLMNLAGRDEFRETEQALVSQLEMYLLETNDPRVINGGDIFETYRRFSGIRKFPKPSHVQERHEKLIAEGWQPLFNGNNLDGWKASTPSDSFSVVNGMIKVQSTGKPAPNGYVPKLIPSHLYYTGPVNGADFTDFELMVEVMTTPQANSGIYFHTKYQEEGFPNAGHEVQVNNTNPHKVKTGSLFSVMNLPESKVSDHEFFTEHITVKGKHVVVKVNGETTVDYVEPEGYSHKKYTERRVDHGTFALQAHDADSLVYFREIWVRPLND